MKGIADTFRVHRQLSELYRDHDVYIHPFPSLRFNDFVRISRTGPRDGTKSIYVWVRFIDDYYRTFYNAVTDSRFGDPALSICDDLKPIVLCKYYRVRLGLDDTALENVDLTIKVIRNPMKKIRALLGAPDSLVRTTTVISVISVLLGIIALVLGILSLI